MSYIDNIRKVVPYTPGEQPKVEGEIIKLNTNEFPYPPSAMVEKALESLDIDTLRLYPNVTAAPLARAIAKYYGFEEDEVFVGVGSDDVLANSFLTFFASDVPILFPDITYSFYDVWADLYKIPYVRVPLKDDFTVDVNDYKVKNGGIVIANPNAPTGIALPLESIEEIVKANPDVIVIVDEAYVDFGGESALPLVRKYENLLVVQTFSKSRAAAGMRIGFAVGNKTLIKYLSDVKFSINSYTMNQMALAAGVAAIEDKEYFKETVTRVINTRNWANKQLVKLGFNVLPSSTNFVFASHKDVPARDIFEYLKTKNIFVRYFNKDRIDNYLRITIGTKEQMEKLVKVLEEYLK
ncbi:MAG: histidinol-phosphate transaminase [Lachnospiraceae bacterium]|nr:histidinol-phosphate transaminase [Lachnospiraceae bacterium]